VPTNALHSTVTRYTPLQIVRTTPNSGSLAAKSRTHVTAPRQPVAAAAVAPTVVIEEDPVPPSSPPSSIASVSPARGVAANYARGLSQSMDQGAEAASSDVESPPPPPRSKRASAQKAAAKITTTVRAITPVSELVLYFQYLVLFSCADYLLCWLELRSVKGSEWHSILTLK